MRGIVYTAALGLIAAAVPRSAQATGLPQDLYLGSLHTTPESQGWLTYQSLGGTHATAADKTTVDTTDANSTGAGFATYSYNPILGTANQVNPNLPSLDRVAGYTVLLNMKVLTESHASTDRSGVDLIITSADTGGQKLGIELSFWADHVWAQNAGFTHSAEDAPFTTTNQTQYAVNVLGTTYSLTANGSPLLSGSLRDYSANGLPYTLPNFVFVGDDTTSAQGSFEFSRLAVVPEPSMLGFGLVAGMFCLARRHRRERAATSTCRASRAFTARRPAGSRR